MDKNHFVRFLDRESPNSLETDRYGNEKFTFWKANYEARDGDYAVFAIQNIVRFFLAKLNYSLYKGLGKMRPASNNQPLYARWSPLQEPFFYLIFDEAGEYVNYRPMDFEYRRRAEIATREDIDERIINFRKLPNFPAVSPKLSKLDKRLMNALLSFQDGITAESTQQSFFSFWRGVENLAQAEREQSHSEVMDRVLPVFNIETADEYMREDEDTALDNVSDARNRLVHDGPNTPHGEYDSRVTKSKQLVAKRLLDKLLEFYLRYYEKGYDGDDFQIFLKYMTETQSKNKQSAEVLDDVLNYRSQ